jgi:hypothetical protein
LAARTHQHPTLSHSPPLHPIIESDGKLKLERELDIDFEHKFGKQEK